MEIPPQEPDPKCLDPGESNLAATTDAAVADVIKSEATLHFEIENFSKLNRNMFSEKLMIRNLPWNLYITFSKTHNRDDFVSFFVQCNVDSHETWSCKASLVFRIVSSDPVASPHFEKQIFNHLFHNRENDWGFKQYISMQQLLDPRNCYAKDDRIVFEADVMADAPHGVGWNSKKFSGFVGLKNQGATCYMNSLLQILYFTNRFRKFVYKMPTEGTINSNTLPLALQRIFYDLQFNSESVCIKNLINSFGWKPAEIFMQHDVQEFLRIILDKLEKEMKNTSLEGSIPKLFEGQMKSFIRCIDVAYESCNMETFYDIQLNVRDFKNVEHSLKNYTEIEILDGNNKYNIENYGPQTAEKGMHFISFPPVLHLHLMRYHYDQKIDRAVKCNDHFEFFEKLNVAQFLEKTPDDEHMDVDDDPKLLYTLQAVLVHSGDNASGHYLVYINPKCDGNWFKFDDEIVCQCKKSEAIQDNYGGKANETTNAYMLVYICDAEIANILEEAVKEDIPAEVLEKLDNDRRIETQQMLDEENTFRIAIFTEEDLERVPITIDYRLVNFKIFQLAKRATCREFYEFIRDIFNLNEPFYLFAANTCTNELIFLNLDEPAMNLVFFDNFNFQSQDLISLFLFTPRVRLTGTAWVKKQSELTIKKMSFESIRNKSFETLKKPSNETLRPTTEDAVSNKPFDETSDVLLILKAYYPLDRTVLLYDVNYFPKTTCFKDLIPPNLEFKDFRMYHNNSVDLFEVSDYNATLELLKNGDTLFLEPILDNPTDGEELITLAKFFDHKLHCVEVRFIDKNKMLDKGFILQLLLKNTYQEMLTMVADKLQIDPNNIIFYENTKIVNKPISKYIGLVADILKSSNHFTDDNIIFYEIDEVAILASRADANQNMCTLEMEYLSWDMTIQYKIKIACRPQDTVKQLLQKVFNNVKEAKRSLRLLFVMLKKIMFIVSDDKTVEFLQMLNQKHASKDLYFRVEEIPDDQLGVTKSEILLPIIHFDREVDKAFGTPFLMKLKNFETFESFRKRVLDKLNVSKRDVRKYELNLIHLNEVIPITNDMQIFNVENFRQARHQLFFGLNHSNTTINEDSAMDGNLYSF